MNMTTRTTTLYRGNCNNGVHTVLTQEAVDALEQRRQLALQFDTYDGTEALLKIAARGTFSFVPDDENYSAYYRGFVTGTLEELDQWSSGDLLPLWSSNYVPFSNGNLGQDSNYIRTPGEVITAFDLVRRAV